jgi:hypothetical protein
MPKTEGANMSTKRTEIGQFAVGCFGLLLLMVSGACSRQPQPQPEVAGPAPTPAPAVRQIPAGKEFSGFLSDYAKLKPNPKFENTLSFVNSDPAKNIHRYVAVIVEPVTLYVASNADPKTIPERGRAALAEYFQTAVTRAVQSAFPVMTEKGPLVLRLRSAIIGIDVGPAGSPDQKAADGALERAVNIGKVGVEVELVDSETGEQIAAAVDRQNLGEGAVVGSANFSREEKFRSATQAFDGWAARLRAFLDAAHELSPEDRTRADQSYRPYGAGK